MTLTWCWRNEHHLKENLTGSGYFRRAQGPGNQMPLRYKETRPSTGSYVNCYSDLWDPNTSLSECRPLWDSSVWCPSPLHPSWDQELPNTAVPLCTQHGLCTKSSLNACWKNLPRYTPACLHGIISHQYIEGPHSNAVWKLEASFLNLCFPKSYLIWGILFKVLYISLFCMSFHTFTVPLALPETFICLREIQDSYSSRQRQNVNAQLLIP